MIATYSDVIDKEREVLNKVSARERKEIAVEQNEAKIKELEAKRTELTQELWNAQVDEKNALSEIAIYIKSYETRTEIPGTEENEPAGLEPQMDAMT